MNEITHHSDPPLDCRGVPIEVGATVVTAISNDRLVERRVTKITRPGRPEWWVDVWCDDGFSTTPDRVVVVPPL